jgi:lipopolysaccharide transport system permease protein
LKTSKIESENWDLIIQAKTNLFALNLREVWRYRDLLMLFVRRDFIAQYKQTVLGPLWHFISPVFTTLIYTFIFGNVAKLSTDGVPKMVFYMSGIIIWNFFAQTFTATGSTFLSNAGIFGKVYFPRLVSPLATVLSKTIQFILQLFLLLCFLGYYKWNGQLTGMEWFNLIYLPFVVVLMSGFGLGLGIILSSLTTKYRDLNVLIGFGINLFMYATPVIYPLSSVPDKYRFFLEWNPISPLIEFFRYLFTGVGTFTLYSIGYSTFMTIVFLFLGMLIFNRVEKTFMDTV